MAKTLYWINDDLRTQDNPALNAALGEEAMLPIYIHDTTTEWPIQGAAAWWLHHSLKSLSADFDAIGFKLQLSAGEPVEALCEIVTTQSIEKIVCSRAYSPAQRSQQKELNSWCKKNNIEFIRYPSTLLAEPEAIKNQQNSYYKVFTPFSKQYKPEARRNPTKLSATVVAEPLTCGSLTLEELDLLPTLNWASEFPTHWSPGENGAHAALKEAIENKVSNYADERDLMALDGTSKLSAHLRFGEITPAQIWHDVSQVLDAESSEKFLRQLIWRDFNYHLLFHMPEIPTECFNKKFSQFPWRDDARALKCWQRGQTGYPVVDAAMTQLWRSGWMHNRARMIVASFLTKHLLISWQHGARWFWDTLVDADLANNTGGWQWTAGCGADAAPYFRIFNPITQGEKFDPSGNYVREWLPQLAKLPKKYIYRPWEAPKQVLDEAGVKLGENYPKPIVEHSNARTRALDTYKAIQS